MVEAFDRVLLDAAYCDLTIENEEDLEGDNDKKMDVDWDIECENIETRASPSNVRSSLRYNGVRGWDIECRMMEDEDGGEKRAPLIYSPIAGELVGRTRLVFDQNGAYSGCDNDGMFIVGTGDWIGFEARLYNVKTREDLGFGRKRIVQGEPIGTRLECDSSPDSVFLEMRYQGRVVDISDVISAQKCQLPQLPDLFK
ncbi:hypothetical protein Y032_0034g2856 [Ancylostoma ceylanicum]|uniref:Peptidase M23 domain-containing protein n=1 Tax=Ancylostoma ceylanicum TaxID=53326 RepID=A0A016ULZ5_9BILA|nr:hypothetical protein Y032_0034g2856 [Ancylostoma ceylanicum]